MKKQGHRVSFRHLLALLAMTVGAAAFVGCTVTPESTDSDELSSEETPGEAQEALTCCKEGTFICASNGYDIDYIAPNLFCEGTTRPVALANCKSHCGGVACIDSGWSTICL